MTDKIEALRKLEDYLFNSFHKTRLTDKIQVAITIEEYDLIMSAISDSVSLEVNFRNMKRDSQK